MDNSALLLWGMIFSTIGLAFFVYGKKQKSVVPLTTGVALFVFPYFVSNVAALILVGGVLVALPYFFRK